MTHPTPPPIGHHLRERRQASRRLELIDAQHKPNELCRGGRVIAHVLVSWYWRSSGLEKAKQKNKRTSARVNTPCTLQLPAKTSRMSCWWQINIYHNDQVLGSLPKLMDYCSLLHLLYFIGNSCQVPLSTKRDEPVFWNRQGSPNEFDACMHWVCMWTCIFVQQVVWRKSGEPIDSKSVILSFATCVIHIYQHVSYSQVIVVG